MSGLGVTGRTDTEISEFAPPKEEIVGPSSLSWGNSDPTSSLVRIFHSKVGGQNQVRRRRRTRGLWRRSTGDETGSPDPSPSSHTVDDPVPDRLRSHPHPHPPTSRIFSRSPVLVPFLQVSDVVYLKFRDNSPFRRSLHRLFPGTETSPRYPGPTPTEPSPFDSTYGTHTTLLTPLPPTLVDSLRPRNPTDRPIPTRGQCRVRGLGSLGS